MDPLLILIAAGCIAALMLHAALAKLADRDLFGAAVAYVFQPAGLAALFQGMNTPQIDAFIEDRKTMRTGGGARMAVPEATGQLHGWLQRLTDHLADGRPFLVMELLSGPSLRDEIDLGGALGPARAAEVLGISRPTLYDLMNRFGIKKETST